MNSRVKRLGHWLGLIRGRDSRYERAGESAAGGPGGTLKSNSATSFPLDSFAAAPSAVSSSLPSGPAQYFVMGCARSGTTSLSRILDTATNGVCLVEPAPALNYETREMMEGRLSGVHELLHRTLAKRAAEHLDRGLVYGEKNVTLGPFIGHIQRMLNARFVLVTRDGRDVVRSLLDWHERLFGNVYRECAEVGDLSARARAAAAALPPEQDWSDYARPRPQPGDTWYPRWAKFGRLEMCAWYWSRINELFLDQLARTPATAWTRIDYTRPDARKILEVARFLGLEGLDTKEVRRLLDRRINSLTDRIAEEDKRPRWPEWPPRDRISFENIATPTMQRLGYYPRDGYVRYKPPHYGNWWREHQGGTDWYEWMYGSRIPAHRDFQAFVRRIESASGRLGSVLEVGCGRAVGYSDFFSDYRYVGVDLSEKEVAWCLENRRKPGHDYLAGDFITGLTDERFDLVFSQGTIDNVYDMDAWLTECVRRSKGYIYVTAYRGWFDGLREHRYVWDEGTTCFYNDIAACRVRELLAGLGCTAIEVEPLAMSGGEIPLETRIVARVLATQ